MNRSGDWDIRKLGDWEILKFPNHPVSCLPSAQPFQNEFGHERVAALVEVHAIDCEPEPELAGLTRMMSLSHHRHMQVFTIGYEGAQIDEFISSLAKAGIREIIDVRELPLSRKRGFSKAALSYTLSIAGIKYVHIPRLGSPRDVRKAYWESGNWTEFCNSFLQHLAGERDALDQALAEVRLGGACLLCFEADQSKCHRSMVAKALAALMEGDLEVINLPSPRKAEGLFAQIP